MPDTNKTKKPVPPKNTARTLACVHGLARQLDATNTELGRILTRLSGLPDVVAGAYRAAFRARTRGEVAAEKLLKHADRLRSRHDRRVKWGF